MRCSLGNHYLVLLGKLGPTKQYRCCGCGMIFSRVKRQHSERPAAAPAKPLRKRKKQDKSKDAAP